MKSMILVSLFAAAAFSGCNGLPSAYKGTYTGQVGGQDVALTISSNSINLGVNRKSQAISQIVDGFSAAVNGVSKEQGGVYLLPSVVSIEGIPVNSPWMPRQDLSTIGYHDGVEASDHLLDLYAVVPMDPSSPPFDLSGIAPIPLDGSISQFAAFVLYAQLDTKASSSVGELQIQIVPQAELTAVDVDLAGLVKMKELGFNPQPGDSPVILSGTLTRN